MDAVSVMKVCPKCYSECSNKAQICPSCSFLFSKVKRIWRHTVSVASAVSLFIGLIVVVINQSTQILDRLKPTEFVFLGIGSATGTNRLITDNFTLGIKSGGSIILEKIEFYGSDKYSSLLSMDILVGRGYKSNDIANIRINPTAIDRSYQPVSYEMLASFIKAHVKINELPFFFKIRPTSIDNKFYINNPKASILGESKISYFELSDESHEKLFKTYPVNLLLWVRKLDNLRHVLDRNEFSHIDKDKLINNYVNLTDKLTKKHNKVFKPN